MGSITVPPGHTLVTNVQDLLDCLCWCPVNDPRGGGNSDSITGLICKTWNVGWIDAGSLSRTAIWLMIRFTSNRPTNHGTTFLEVTWSGKSLDDSDTRCPGR